MAAGTLRGRPGNGLLPQPSHRPASTEGTLSHHVVEAWKLSPNRDLKRIPIPDLLNRPTWPDRIRRLIQEPFDTLIGIAATEPIARDAAGNLYTRFAWCQKDGPPP